MFISTVEFVPGHQIVQILGVVRGSTVRSRNVTRDFVAGIRGLIGGEVTEYTKLQAQAREQAIQRMVADATRIQADAVINVRFNTSMIVAGAAEILVYGTAVRIRQTES